MGRDILVVDDNADIRETLAEVLELVGYPVRQAENGKVALELALARRPGVVLLDLMMPVMNGWELIAAMRAAPRLRLVPIVVVSAAPSRPPGLPFLEKPASVDDVLGAIRMFLPEPP